MRPGMGQDNQLIIRFSAIQQNISPAEISNNAHLLLNGP
jgi:hypothetical protein